jgi:hypothetical protein
MPIVHDLDKRKLLPKHLFRLMLTAALHLDFKYPRRVLDGLDRYSEREHQHRMLGAKSIGNGDLAAFRHHHKGWNEAIEDYNRQFDYIFGKEKKHGRS